MGEPYTGPAWFNKAFAVVAVAAVFTIIVGWITAGDEDEEF